MYVLLQSRGHRPLCTANERIQAGDCGLSLRAGMIDVRSVRDVGGLGRNEVDKLVTNEGVEGDGI